MADQTNRVDVWTGCFLLLLILAIAQPGVARSDAPRLEDALDGSLVLQTFSSPDIPTTFGTTRPYATLELDASPAPGFDLYLFAWLGSESGSRLEVDELNATLSLLPDNRLDATLGRQYLPFGYYEKSAISAPLTQDIGSLRADQAVTLRTETGPFQASLYGFRGSAAVGGEESAERRSGVGLRLEYRSDESMLGVDYISNLSDSGYFFPNDIAHRVSGVAVSASLDEPRWTLLARYVATLDPLAPGDLEGAIETPVKPSATQLEFDYEVSDAGTLALFWSQARQSSQLDVITEVAGLAWRYRFSDHLVGAGEVSQLIDSERQSDLVFGVSLTWRFIGEQDED